MRCDSFEKGADADEVTFVAKEAEKDDVPGSYLVTGTLALQVTKPEDRGQYEVGKDYNVEVTPA